MFTGSGGWRRTPSGSGAPPVTGGTGTSPAAGAVPLPSFGGEKGQNGEKHAGDDDEDKMEVLKDKVANVVQDVKEMVVSKASGDAKNEKRNGTVDNEPGAIVDKGAKAADLEATEKASAGKVETNVNQTTTPKRIDAKDTPNSPTRTKKDQTPSSPAKIKVADTVKTTTPSRESTKPSPVVKIDQALKSTPTPTKVKEAQPVETQLDKPAPKSTTNTARATQSPIATPKSTNTTTTTVKAPTTSTTRSSIIKSPTSTTKPLTPSLTGLPSTRRPASSAANAHSHAHVTPSPLRPQVTGTPTKPTASSLAKARIPSDRSLNQSPGGDARITRSPATSTLGTVGRSGGNRMSMPPSASGTGSRLVAQRTGTGSGEPRRSPSVAGSTTPGHGTVPRAPRIRASLGPNMGSPSNSPGSTANTHTPTKSSIAPGSRLLQGTAASRAKAAALASATASPGDSPTVKKGTTVGKGTAAGAASGSPIKARVKASRIGAGGRAGQEENDDTSAKDVVAAAETAATGEERDGRAASQNKDRALKPSDSSNGNANKDGSPKELPDRSVENAIIGRVGLPAVHDLAHLSDRPTANTGPGAVGQSPSVVAVPASSSASTNIAPVKLDESIAPNGGEDDGDGAVDNAGDAARKERLSSEDSGKETQYTGTDQGHEAEEEHVGGQRDDYVEGAKVKMHKVGDGEKGINGIGLGNVDVDVEEREKGAIKADE